MTDSFRATIHELAAEYNRQVQLTRDVYAKLNELRATATSGDGMVSVTVGPRGQVRAIKLNPRVYRRLSPSELAAAIMAQIGRASAQVAERTKELMAPLMPEGLPYEEIFGQGVDLDAFLPAPARPDEER